MCIRFLIPRDQKVVIQDLVRGEVEWECSLMPDPVIAPQRWFSSV